MVATTRTNQFFAVLAILSFAAAPAQAQLYWDSNGTTAGAGSTPTGTWGVDNFWNTDPTGEGDGTFQIGTLITSDLFFSAGNDAVDPYTVSLNSVTQSARLVTFKNGTATLNSGTLNLGNLGGITVTSNAVTGATISSNLTISGIQAFNVAAGRTLTLNTGTFTRNAGATLNVASTGTVTTTMTGLDSGSLVNSIIGPWASYGSGASTRYATIDGSNNIVGLTGTAAATAANVTDTLGTFNYDVGAVGALGGGANINALRYTGAAGTITGALTTRGIMNVGGGALVFSGAMTSGTGEMVINAANGSIRFSGGLNNGGNLLTITGANTVFFNNTSNVVSGAGGLTYNGNGLLDMASSGTLPAHSYTGPTTVNSGILLCSPAANNLYGTATGNITLSGGVIMTYFGGSITRAQGSGVNQIQILGGVSGFGSQGNSGSTFNVGAVTWGSATFNPSVLQLQPTTNVNVNGQLTFSSAINLNGADRTISVGAIDLTGTANASGVISNGSGTAGIIKTGTGPLTLGNAGNTFNGPLTINSGWVIAGASGSLGNAGATNTLIFNGGTLRATGTITSPATRSVTMTATGIIDTNSQAISIAGNIGGAGGLTKNGAGTLTLSGANGYLGTTTVNAGTLTLSGSGTLGATTAPLSIGAGTLNLASFAPTVGAVTITGAGSLQNGSLTGTSYVDSNAGFNATISANLLGSGVTYTKSGTGTTILTGTNGYTGATAVDAGALLVNSGGSLHSGSAVSVGAGGTLGGNGTINGTVNFASNSQYSPGASGAIGTLTLTNASASAMTLGGSTGLFDLPASGASDRIAVTGGLVVNNTNTILLKPTSTTGVAAGVYNLITSSALSGAGSFVLANGSATRGNATVSVSGNDVILTVAAGGLAGTSTFNGPYGSGGTDRWNVAGSWSGGVPTGAINAFIPDQTTTSVIAVTGATTPAYTGDLWIGNNVTLQINFTSANAAYNNALGTPGSTIIYMGANSAVNYRNNGINPTMPAITLLGDASMRFQESTQVSASPNFANSISGPFTLTFNSGNGPTYTLNAANTFAGLNLAGTTGIVNAAVSGSIGVANLTISGGGTVNLNHASAISDHSNPIRIDNGTLAYASSAAAALTLSSRPIQLNGSGQATINNNASSSANILTLAGGISSTASGAKTLTLGGTNVGQNTVSGAISNGTGGGTLALTKAGAGQWILSGSNTYTGATTVNAGTLQVNSLANGGAASSIGASSNAAGNLLLANATTLRYTGSGHSTDRGFTINVGTGGHGASLNASGTGAINFTNAASPSYGTVDQARTLTLTGTNTGNNTLAATIANNGSGVVSLAKTGIGTWVLSGASNSFTGTTALSGGGKLVLDYDTSNTTKLANGAVLTLGGGEVTLRGGSHVEQVGSLTIGNGAHTSITRDGGSSTIALGAISRAQSAGGTLSLAEDNLATTTSAVFNGILGGGVTVGSNWAKVVSGNITALTAGDYTTLTNVSPASLSGSINYQVTGAVSRAGGLVNSLRISGDGDDQTLTISSGNLQPSIVPASTGNSGGILYAGGGNNNYTITGAGNIQAQNGNQELIIHTFQGTLTVDMAVTTGNAAVGLTKAGLGTLILTKPGTYIGATHVNQGALRLRTNTAAGPTAGGIFVQNGAALELANGITVGAKALTITGAGVSNGGALRNQSGSNSYGGSITIGSGGARINADASSTLTLNGAVTTSVLNDVTFGGSGTVVVAGGLAGAGNIIKDGSGTVVLAGANTYSGSTTVNAGLLRLNGSIQSASLVVNAGAVLGGTGAASLATLSGAGSIDPGNSPGILAASDLVPTGGIDFNFEFTQEGVHPDWGNATASINDVLRLTSATPFTAPLDGSNAVSLYLPSIDVGDQFTGGFYTDNNTNFLGSISGAAFTYYVSNVNGNVPYNGGNYSLYTGPNSVSVSTVQVPSANFAGGTATNGWSTQFIVVPEPGALALAGLGIAGVIYAIRRRS